MELTTRLEIWAVMARKSGYEANIKEQGSTFVDAFFLWSVRLGSVVGD